MNLGDNLKRLRKEHGLTLEQLSNELNKLSNGKMNFNKGRISKWENGREEPRLSSVKLIADFYGINIDSLYLDEATNTDINYIYNQLNESRKAKVYKFAEYQLLEQLSTEPRVKVYGTTAAGKAIEYGDPIVEEKEVSFVPKGADCALNVQGDSMEPEIKDGSIIFYTKQPTVENGEIAVVEIEGDGVTCKKVKYDFDNKKIILQSLNPKYEDMVFDDTEIRALGKVLK